jgi:hypothetical protein
MALWSSLNAVSSLIVHCHLTSFFTKLWSGQAIWLKLATNRQTKFANPRNDWTCLTVVGVGHSCTAWILSLSRLNPLSDTIIPKYSTVVWCHDYVPTRPENINGLRQGQPRVKGSQAWLCLLKITQVTVKSSKVIYKAQGPQCQMGRQRGKRCRHKVKALQIIYRTEAVLCEKGGQMEKTRKRFR